MRPCLLLSSFGSASSAGLAESVLRSCGQATLLPLIAASRDALAAIDPDMDAEELQVCPHDTR